MMSQPRTTTLCSSLSNPLIRRWMNQGNMDFDASHFVLPIFVQNQSFGKPVAIESMNGVYRHSLESAIELISELKALDLRSILLFPVMSTKGIQSMTEPSENPIIRVIPMMKEVFPKLFIIVDVCLCAFTDNGHCYVSSSETSGNKNNPLTLEKLSTLSVAYASAGCDMVAPSDMNDGRVAAIRKALDKANYGHVSIMSYSAKFASNFYGPFRDAADSAPKEGDRQSYQLPPGSSALAMRAIERDIQEGADVVMVKPGMMYLDLISESRKQFPHIPRAVYQVSGEYSMIDIASRNKTFKLCEALLEIFTCFRRAGADIIISYFTPIMLKYFDHKSKMRASAADNHL